MESMHILIYDVSQPSFYYIEMYVLCVIERLYHFLQCFLLISTLMSVDLTFYMRMSSTLHLSCYQNVIGVCCNFGNDMSGNSSYTRVLIWCLFMFIREQFLRFLLMILFILEKEVYCLGIFLNHFHLNRVSIGPCMPKSDLKQDGSSLVEYPSFDFEQLVKVCSEVQI